MTDFPLASLVYLFFFVASVMVTGLALGVIGLALCAIGQALVDTVAYVQTLWRSRD